MDPNYKPPTGIRYPKDDSRFVIAIDRKDAENVLSQLDALKSELYSRITILGPNEKINIRIVNNLDAVNCFGDFVTILGEAR
jgi:hypothetical protein